MSRFYGYPVKLTELLELYADTLRAERDRVSAKGLDEPLAATNGRRLVTIGTLHQYAFDLPSETPLGEDLPLTVVPPSHVEPTEGFVIGLKGRTVFVQTFDSLGESVESATLVPDTTGFLQIITQRLSDMVKPGSSYALGPAERLAPWLTPESAENGQLGQPAPVGSVLGTNWHSDLSTRRSKLAALAVELVRNNKRLLVVSPSHQQADALTEAIARALRAAGLTYKSLMTRYEMPLHTDRTGLTLQELGFEAQMHHFFAQSRADKATLRRKYERFRELAPLLAFKAEKQRDLDEVKLLEWRLLTQLTEFQEKIKEVDTTLADYEGIPMWKRLAMQTVGRNTTSLAEYRAIYEQHIKTLQGEVDVAQGRIAELAPQAAIPKDLRPEYEELKEEIARLGGTKQIRELLAAEEGTNRQAFIQNKRIVTTSAARVSGDQLFTRLRFDVLLVDEAPLVPACHLLTAAGLIRERIILSGNQEDLAGSSAWKVNAWATPVAP